MFDLLDTVLPTEGRYCIVGIGKYADQRFADTREEADEIIEEFKRSQVNVYFGCAKVGPLNNRTHENIAFIRALCHFTAVRMYAQPWGYTADNSHDGIAVVRSVVTTPQKENQLQLLMPLLKTI